MIHELEGLLDHLAEALDQEREAEIEDLHRRALSWEPVERLPLVMHYPLPDDAAFRPYPHSQVFDDPAKMLYNQLAHAWQTSIANRHVVGDDLPCTVRANFGTVIIASLFGGRVEQVEDNPPWVRHFQTRQEFTRAMDRDPLDFTRGWGPRVVERYQFYRQTLDAYPTLSAVIKLVLPDLQGPLDTVELLRGSEVFMEMHTDPGMVEHALNAAAIAQVGFARHLAPYLNDGPAGASHQHGVRVRGNILIRDDSSILVAPKMYREQVASHDEFVLDEMGGGGIHCCGSIDHHTEAFLSLPSAQCLDLGQPEMNDLDTIYHMARKRRIALLRLSVAEEELTSVRVLDRFPTGVSLLHGAASLQDARRIMSEYKAACERRAGLRAVNARGPAQ